MKKEKLKEKLIAVDIDGVIADWNSSFLEFLKTKNIYLKYEEIKHPDYAKVLKISNEKVCELFDEFINSEFFYRIKPIEGSIKAIQELSNFYVLYILTSRPEYLKKQTEEWIKKYYEDKFSNIIFTNNKILTLNQLKNKGKFKRSVFIDDFIYNAIEASKNGIEVFLYEQPWNSSLYNPKEHKNIKKVKSWREICEVLIPKRKIKKLFETNLK